MKTDLRTVSDNLLLLVMYFAYIIFWTFFFLVHLHNRTQQFSLLNLNSKNGMYRYSLENCNFPSPRVTVEMMDNG